MKLRLIVIVIAVPAVLFSATNTGLKDIGERYFQIPSLYAVLAQSSPSNREAFASFTTNVRTILADQEWAALKQRILPHAGAYPSGAVDHFAVAGRSLVYTSQSNGCSYLCYIAERQSRYDNFPFLVWDNKISHDDVVDFIRQFAITNYSVTELSNVLASSDTSSVHVALASRIELILTARTNAHGEYRIVEVSERPLGASLTLSAKKRTRAETVPSKK